jgi:hypothetical protein
VEPVKPVYNNIKVIISIVIPAVVSSSGLVETPAQGGDIIRFIIYFDLSTNKKVEFQERHSRFQIFEKNYNKKIDIFTDIINNIQTSIVEN